MGVVHSLGGGNYASTLIINADVNAAAAIAVSKLAPGSNGQALVTAGGVAAWGTVPATGVTPGAANTVLTTDGTGTAVAWNTIVNANVSAVAAIAGTKISPDFGSQNVTTTGNYAANSQAGFLRLGLVAGSGAGAASAASSGSIRGSLGIASTTTVPGGFLIAARNNADTSDSRLLGWDSASNTLLVGGTTGGFDAIEHIITSSSTLIDFFTGGILARFAASTVTLGQPLLTFDDGVANPRIGQSGNFGQDLTVFAQNRAEVVANSLGGDLVLTAGAASLGTATNVGGSIVLIPGTGTGVGASNGGVAIGTTPATTGTIRLAEGMTVFGRNTLNTANVRLLQWITDLLELGGTDNAESRISSATEVSAVIGGSQKLRIFTDRITMNVNQLTFNSAAAPLPIFGVAALNVTGTGVLFEITGQDVNAAGTTNQGGAVLVQAGGCVGASSVANIGGLIELAGGDVSVGATTNIAGHALLRGGRALNTAPVDGSVAFHASPSSWQTGQRIAYFGNAVAAPTGDPANGVFFYSDTARPAWRWAGTTLRINGTSATANVGAGGAPPVTVEGYLDVQINGTQRKIPYYVT